MSTESSVGHETAKAHIIADRYKTRRCRNFVAHGTCPYETRCMFAHGDEELRTTQQNVDQGLVTEEAVRNHQRMLARKMSGQTSSPALTPRSSDSPVNNTAVYSHHPYAYDVEPCCCPDCCPPAPQHYFPYQSRPYYSEYPQPPYNYYPQQYSYPEYGYEEGCDDGYVY